VLKIGDTLVSLDLIECYFACDLTHCKGACCVEGDAGAPLEQDEFYYLRNILASVWNDLSPAAQAVIERQGIGYIDPEGDTVTSIVNGKDCVFTCYDADGTCRCAIEKAFHEHRSNMLKPISCYLYPVRIRQYSAYTAVNFHRWKICRSAEVLGKHLNMRAYRFLREPLICKFGEAWYAELDFCAQEYLKQMK
jgi:hypothetical protein